MKEKFSYLREVRRTLFRNILRTIASSRTGHLGACCSSLDLMIVLYFGGVLRFSVSDPHHPLRDYVLNRGHLGPLKYNIFHILGWMKEEEMLSYRKFGSRMAGHETMGLTPGIDITPSGSLGMVLSYAAGAVIGWNDAKMANRVFCFLGDGEEQEGNVSEAARHIAHLGLKNIICVIDRNGGQLSTRTKETGKNSHLKKIWEGYGWKVLGPIDGHNHKSIFNAYEEAQKICENGPVVIIADTIKGFGIPGAEEDYCGYHAYHGSEAHEDVRHIDIHSPLATLEAQKCIDPEYLKPEGYNFNGFVHKKLPTEALEINPLKGKALQYDVLLFWLQKLEKKLGKDLYILSSDYPPRNFVYDEKGFALKECCYLNTGLREQHMTAMAHGIATVRPDALVVILCGDAFLYRHMDQMNVLSQSGTKVIIYSVQAGFSGARNGSTHQSSGQSGAMITMPGMFCEEPSTLKDLVDSSNKALDHNGPTYVRMHKGKVPWDYNNNLHVSDKKEFTVLRWNKKAEGTIISCGMMTTEALKTVVKLLEEYYQEWNLISLTALSPIGSEFTDFIASNKPLVTLYNGNPEILFQIVAQQILLAGKRVSQALPLGFYKGRTGSVGELMKHYKLDADSIAQRCSQLNGRPK